MKRGITSFNISSVHAFSMHDQNNHSLTILVFWKPFILIINIYITLQFQIISFSKFEHSIKKCPLMFLYNGHGKIYYQYCNKNLEILFKNSQNCWLFLPCHIQESKFLSFPIWTSTLLIYPLKFLISLHSVTPKWNIKVTQINKMIPNLRNSCWLLNKFSYTIPWEMYKAQFGEYADVSV